MAQTILMNVCEFFEGKRCTSSIYLCEYTQQNGITERKNKHLLAVACAIMFSMNVPKYLWGEAVLTASF